MPPKYGGGGCQTHIIKIFRNEKMGSLYVGNGWLCTITYPITIYKTVHT